MVDFKPQQQAQEENRQRNWSRQRTLDDNESSRGKEAGGSVSQSHKGSSWDFNSFLCLPSCVERPLVITQQLCGWLLACIYWAPAVCSVPKRLPPSSFPLCPPPNQIQPHPFVSILFPPNPSTIHRHRISAAPMTAPSEWTSWERLPLGASVGHREQPRWHWGPRHPRLRETGRDR